MKTPRSIDALAATTAKLARGENALMLREARALRDSVAGLNRAIKDPRIAAKRAKTKKTTSTPWLTNAFDTVNFFTGGGASGTIRDAAGGFLSSAAQMAGAQYAALTASQRIR
ncbi:MAG: hypothetical protein KGI37_08475 [Alphaproteobacteria bacterium]|nr:hypothetical protein [Alphaproteobacteria bacterium]